MSKSNRVGLVRTGLAVWDALTWAVAALGLVLTRYNFVLTGEQTQIVFIYAASAMVLQIAIGFATKLYRGRHGIASFEETALLAVVALGIGAGLAVLFALYAPSTYPRVVTFPVPR